MALYLVAIARPRNERRPIVVYAEVVPARGVRRESRAETSPFARYLRSPRHLGQRREARHRQILHGSDVPNGFAPNWRFDSDNVLFGDPRHVKRWVPIVGG